MTEEHKNPNDETPEPITVDSEFHLEEHEGDITVTNDLLNQINLFSNLARPINISKYPGCVVIRSYRRGEVICATGQEGGTAFYVLTHDEETRVKQAAGLIADSTAAQETKVVADTSARDRHVLSIWFPTSKTRARPKGFLEKLISRSERVRDTAIPALLFDGDATADEEMPDRLKLKGGDIFGEMSCKSHAPRSATIIAHVDCLLVEMNRNVFERIDGDKKYKEASFQKFKIRTLDTFLRQLQMFRNLTEQQIQSLIDTAELLVVKPGNVICEEGEKSTTEKPLDVFLVRNGCVQVTKHHRLSLREQDITDWREFCAELDAIKPEFQPVPETKKETAARPAATAATAAAQRVAGSPAATPRSSGPLAQSPSAKSPLAQARPAKAALPTAGASASAAEETKESQSQNSSEPATPPLIKPPTTAPAATPGWLVKSWLSEPVLEAIRTIATSAPAPEPVSGATREQPSDETQDQKKQSEPQDLKRAREIVLDALNQLARNPDFLNEKLLAETFLLKSRFARKTATYPKGLAGIKDSWKELELRSTAIEILGEIFPRQIKRSLERTPPPQVLRYLTRGDCFGEMAVVSGDPRVASCIAYSHPSVANKLSDPRKARRFGDVELVRIPGRAFVKLMDDSPEMKDAITQLIQKNKAGAKRHEVETDSELLSSPEFQDMGLFQGSRLLVVDLNNCTRCGDCVEACIKTHDDGQTRLFLDGPKFDHFLVPSACRSCLNPVCMIGCPVGSIRRGDNGQIEIKDWCIGCGICSGDCPYDSIQMHDLGIIREDSPGWIYAPKSLAGKNWYAPARWFAPRPDGERWRQITSPVLWEGDLLKNALQTPSDHSSGSDGILCFRHEFPIPAGIASDKFRLSINRKRDKYSIITGMKTISTIRSVYLNGKELKDVSGGEWNWEKEAFELDRSRLNSGSNLLAIELSVNTSTDPNRFRNLILSAGIDPVLEVNEQTRIALGKQKTEANARVEIETIVNRAVVCDLCSHLPSKQPACVTSCPHDAAIRINPLFDFPSDRSDPRIC